MTTADESLDRLHRTGWSVGHAAFVVGEAMVWQVDGANGENVVVNGTPTQPGALAGTNTFR